MTHLLNSPEQPVESTLVAHWPLGVTANTEHGHALNLSR